MLRHTRQRYLSISRQRPEIFPIVCSRLLAEGKTGTEGLELTDKEFFEKSRLPVHFIIVEPGR
jgi:hypothetical protein